MENKQKLICYSEETVSKMMEALSHIEVKGITSVTALSAVMQLLNNVAKEIPAE